MAGEDSRAASRPPNVTLAVQKVIRDAGARLPEFSRVDASRVLVLLGEARRASRASVRPMHFAETASRHGASSHVLRPRVRFRGRNIYYVLTLRPLFFLNATPEARIFTIIHEMFHFSEQFDGTLDPRRRHAVLGKSFNQHLSPLVDRYLEEVPDSLWRSMALNRTVRARMWLEKPGLSSMRIRSDGKRIVQGKQLYTEKDTFLATFKMRTPRKARERRAVRSRSR